MPGQRRRDLVIADRSERAPEATSKEVGQQHQGDQGPEDLDPRQPFFGIDRFPERLGTVVVSPWSPPKVVLHLSAIGGRAKCQEQGHAGQVGTLQSGGRVCR